MFTPELISIQSCPSTTILGVAYPLYKQGVINVRSHQQ